MLNDSKWIEYRLGDIIKGRFLMPKMQYYLDRIEKELPDSIGGLYIKRTKDLELQKRKNNYDILRAILAEKAENIEVPSENDIVFHLRLGDIIAGFKFGEVILGKENWGLTLREVKGILPKVKAKTASKKIILVYGSHKTGINEIANRKYLAAIKALLQKNGFEVVDKSGTDPDYDFIYMSQSKIFIKSGGGFSRIISRIVRKNGGIVFTKDDSPMWSAINRFKINSYRNYRLLFFDKRRLINDFLGASIERFPRLYKFYLQLKNSG